MTDPGQTSPPPRTFAVRYDQFAGLRYNLDLCGEGTLTIEPAGPVYCFSGLRRSFVAVKQLELRFSPAEISEVATEHKAVQFMTPKGVSGAKKKPFVFFCHDRAEAEEITALLVQHVPIDAVTQAAQNRIQLLPTSAHCWGSITNILVATNVAVFVAGQALRGDTIVFNGANNAAATTQGEWWRLVTSMFIHAGPLHLACNLWALYQAGRLLERLLGRSLFALVYLGAGIAGSLASIWWNGDKVWSVGASGAVFGVYGALLSCVAALRHRKEITASVLRGTEASAALFAIYNVLYGVTAAGIDNAAHVGGFLGGLGFGWLAVQPLDLELRAREFPRRLGFAVFGLGALLAVGILTAPQFDYRVREHRKWTEFARACEAQEKEYVQETQAALSELATRRTGIQLVTRIPGKPDAAKAPAKRPLTANDLPVVIEIHARFCEAAAAKAQALAFTPGLRTDRDRRTFLDAIEKKSTGLRRLSKMFSAAAELERMERDFKNGLRFRAAALTSGQALLTGGAEHLRIEVLPFLEVWEGRLESLTLPSAGATAEDPSPAFGNELAGIARQLAAARDRILGEIRTVQTTTRKLLAESEAASRKR